MARTPFLQFCKEENISPWSGYAEAREGRLKLTKVRARTFVDDVDREAWRALAPKVSGRAKAGEHAMQVAALKIAELGKVVAAGLVDRDHVVAHLRKAIREAGLVADQAA
jgi:hypothetical protein